MEQRFKTSGQDIDLLPLREFIEREGDPTRWFAFVTEGCFKYITYGLSERLRVGDRRSGIERAHITWLDKSLTFGQLQTCLLGTH